ncbi:hypothetical protein ABIC09_001421 [Bradyrhizobium sp. S3.12.5]|nr:hypothetical protein [Bradyrhizobium cytisi]
MLSLATIGAGFVTRPIGGIVLGRRTVAMSLMPETAPVKRRDRRI